MAVLEVLHFANLKDRKIQKFPHCVGYIPVENSVIYDDTSRSVLTDAFSDNFGDATKDVFNEKGSDMSVDFDTIKPFQMLHYKSLNLVDI